MSNKMKIEAMKITPDQAEEWLGRNTRNRHLSDVRIEQYAGAIKRGEWQLSGDPIRFDRNGVLLDGQHRLIACVNAETPFESVVITNLPPESQEVMDTGARRGFHHVLQLRGYAGASQLSSAVRALYWYRQAGRFDSRQTGGERKPGPTNQQLMNLLNANKGIEESTAFVNHCRHTGSIKLPAGVAAFHYIVVSRFDQETANEFLENLVDFSYGGSGKHDPIVALRKRLVESQGGRETPSRVKMALMVKAFNHWMHGEDAPGGSAGLRWRSGGPAPEAFPEIVKPEDIG